ncbi:TetR/AcrR family transcriptional regulator [Bacillus haynesii]|uniref:TetR/AcrR family transcriptional regulator n=1 Tax=Bacillus haynesii TaxID=1925021 RepID=UPI00227F17B5|nr:TetR/AcrR family transcriptional regulator [Bacillus haynesii]MCY8755838.1 TetR/AcrR family transcriptional regulator [Bacillus haynesii]
MTRENIKRTAVRQFNELGYEGVKMSHIAKELGIRKQSLAYHFSSKKEMLMEIYPEIVEEEISFINEFFDSRKHTPAKSQIYDFLKETQVRFHALPNVAFLQAMSFYDGLNIQLVYENKQSFKRSLEISFDIFWRGLL